MGLFIDNPIIVKHLRSRLRPAQTWPGAIGLGCLAAVLTWLAFASERGGGAGGFIAGSVIFSLLWCLLGLVLVVLGSEQVATAVSVARETGILDFHRISPLSPASVAIGFFLGAPIRETCYAALLLPFLLATAALARLPWTTVLELLAEVVIVAGLVHASQLLAALVSRRPRAARRGFVVLLLSCLAVGAAVSAGRGGRLADVAAPPFFGVPVPRVVFLGLHAGAATAFLLVASTRRLRDQRAPLLSKWQALACMATVATLAVGDLWTAPSEAVLVTLLTTLVAAGVACAVPVAVTSGEYLKGVRRASRSGRSGPPPLDVAAPSGWTVGGLCLVVAVAAAVVQRRLAADESAWMSAWAIGLLVIATHGFALQYFRLRAGHRGDVQCHLALFLLWVLPVPVAAAWSASGLEASIGSLLWEATPWAGMTRALAAAAGEVVAPPWTALVTTALTAVGFWDLQRRQATLVRREAGLPAPDQSSDDQSS